jgi:hypothetical protein
VDIRATRDYDTDTKPCRGGTVMIDVTTKKPLRVSNEYPPAPYIRLPFSQLDEVRRLLDSRSIGYWVDENAISINGGPEMIVINLNRGTDVAGVQTLLNSIN